VVREMISRPLKQSRIVAIAGAMVALLSGVNFATAQTNTNPRFEVATLKPYSVDSPGPMPLSMFPRRNGDRFTWCMFLSEMLSYAYNIPDTRIEGFKSPMDAYVVTATMDPSATDAQARLMLQALLAEKLKLVVHRETREAPGYALVVGKNGPKMKTADASGDPPPMPEDLKGITASANKGRIFTHVPERGVLAAVGRGVSMPQLADELSKNLKTPVEDKTGLVGNYYFELRFQEPEAQLAADQSEFAPAADISSALPDQLGLKLEKAKVPAEYLVVQHWEMPAAE